MEGRKKISKAQAHILLDIQQTHFLNVADNGETQALRSCAIIRYISATSAHLATVSTNSMGKGEGRYNLRTLNKAFVEIIEA